MKSLVAVCVTLVALAGCTEDDGPAGPQGWASQAVEDAWSFLDIFFVFRERLPADPKAYETPQALYRSVHEPYTVYYPHDTAMMVVSYLTSETVDIGAVLTPVASGAVVQEIYGGSPAAVAGMRVNDTILAVGGRSCAGQPLDTIYEWLSGQAGDSRYLSVGRAGGRLAITVVLAPYLAPTVFADSLDSAVAYIALAAFFNETPDPEGSAGEFHDALERTSWARYTIIDLRDNPGGYVSQCLRIAGEFVPVGTAVIRTTERQLRERAPGSDDYYGVTVDTVLRTDYAGIAQSRRCYVLVNRGSASASEILLSCLHDYRALDVTSVGTVTYGKGRGQVFLGYDWDTGEYLLADGGMARITSMLLTPVAGPAYDSVGITPHVLIRADQDALDTALVMIARELGRPLGKARAASAGMSAAARRLRHPPQPVLIDDRRR